MLDHHLATFDRWLQAHFTSLTASSRGHYYLTVVTLLDQLNLKEFDCHQLAVILQYDQLPFAFPDKLLILFSGGGLNIEFTRIVSKFLIDPDRAGPLWLNSHNYADLATYILEILGNK